jgi:hypothetical protein
MQSKKRRRMYIDRRVQGDLFRRVLLYWLFCMLVILYMGVSWIVMPENPRTLGELFAITYSRLGPILTTSVFVLPLALYDCIRMSNRFAGPVYRLHKEIKRLADGQEAAPVNLRKGDYWHEVADDFNRLLERVEQCKPQSLGKSDGGAVETTPQRETEYHSVVP